MANKSIFETHEMRINALIHSMSMIGIFVMEGGVVGMKMFVFCKKKKHFMQVIFFFGIYMHLQL